MSLQQIGGVRVTPRREGKYRRIHYFGSSATIIAAELAPPPRVFARHPSVSLAPDPAWRNEARSMSGSGAATGEDLTVIQRRVVQLQLSRLGNTRWNQRHDHRQRVVHPRVSGSDHL